MFFYMRLYLTAVRYKRISVLINYLCDFDIVKKTSEILNLQYSLRQLLEWTLLCRRCTNFTPDWTKNQNQKELKRTRGSKSCCEELQTCNGNSITSNLHVAIISSWHWEQNTLTRNKIHNRDKYCLQQKQIFSPRCKKYFFLQWNQL